MLKMTNVLAFLLLAMAELVLAQSNTQIRFRNVGSQTVNVIIEVGPNRAQSNFRLEPGTSEVINVGYVSLFWCAYKSGSTCMPVSPASGGAQIDVR
jgi:hypothetical protein